jgi:perosamine synthetase
MSGHSVERIVEAILSVTGGPCALHEPVFRGNEGKYVSECISSGWVSSVGAFVDRIEADLCDYTGAGFAVATVNGTAALHVALLLAGVRKDDEVVIPALSFVATANAVSYCGAIPHFVDVNFKTLGMDAPNLERHLSEVAEVSQGTWRNRQSGRRIAAIVPMHTFGHPCDLHELDCIASKYGIPLVEDAAESLGSFYKRKHTGTVGRLGVLSFNGNKIVTSGGGGAILTNDPELAKQAKHLTTTAKTPHKWQFIHDCVGFNYRMPNLNAALACAQLEQLSSFVTQKRETARHYQKAFAGIRDVTVVSEPQGCVSNYWLNAIRLSCSTIEVRDALLRASNDVGVMTRPCWTPLNRLPMYQDCPHSALNTTDTLFEQLVNIPSGVAVGTACSR